MIDELIEALKNGKIKNKKELEKSKRKLSSKYHSNWPSNIELLKKMDEATRNQFKKLIKIKPVRTLSGVAVIAVMSKPAPCPHGKCTYCPHIDEVPEAYTGTEPAARRAKANNYDPYKQVQNRLAQLTAEGHIVEKCELIIMGGTFLSLPKDYQEHFIKECLRAMNDFPEEKMYDKTLEEIQKENETAKVRCIGITFETRPDFCSEKDIKFMLRMGGTRVELGVQTIYDSIYKKVNRGHKIKDVIKATKLLKNYGFKVLYQMMLGLPGSSPKKDIDAFLSEKGIFKNPDFKPDMIKIYPCLVVKGSQIYEDWKEGKYQPYTEKEAIKIIKEIKKKCPEWIRIMRIERDIPTHQIVAGIKTTNLRQMMNNPTCNCIRCREIGHTKKFGKLNIIKKEVYEASEGKEYFIQIVNEFNSLLGFIRLRINSTEIAYIRELHVYGEQTSIGKKGEVQHKGYGKQLLTEAEKIAKEENKKKMFIISGIGVREYYKKLGYQKEGYYMTKSL